MEKSFFPAEPSRIQMEPRPIRLAQLNIAFNRIGDDDRSEDIVDTDSHILIQELRYRGYEVGIGHAP